MMQHEAVSARSRFFDRVLQQHARLLYRVAFSVLRNAADAEDAVADALLKLVRTGAWQNVANERAFLSRVVWRAALDRFEARGPDVDGHAELALLSDSQRSPETEVLEADLYQYLHAMIDRLSPELREPLLLSALRELNSREIGEIMHLPEGTVRTRLMRARAVLRDQVESLQSSRSRELTARGMNR